MRRFTINRLRDFSCRCKPPAPGDVERGRVLPRYDGLAWPDEQERAKGRLASRHHTSNRVRQCPTIRRGVLITPQGCEPIKTVRDQASQPGVFISSFTSSALLSFNSTYSTDVCNRRGLSAGSCWRHNWRSALMGFHRPCCVHRDMPRPGLCPHVHDRVVLTVDLSIPLGATGASVVDGSLHSLVHLARHEFVGLCIRHWRRSGFRTRSVLGNIPSDGAVHAAGVEPAALHAHKMVCVDWR